jgi:hypothetical protein
MNCFYCGECCLRKSLLSAQKLCTNLMTVDNFYFCKCYDHRPVECIKQHLSSKACSIGSSILAIHDSDKVQQRLNTGHTMLKHCKAEDVHIAS